MNDTRLDALRRVLGQGVHRRGVLGVLAGLAGLDFGEAVATHSKRDHGKVHTASAGGCHHYEGTFTAVRPETCDGTLCTHGTLVGDFPSTYDFTATQVDFNTGAYSGHSTITTKQGARLFGHDSGVLVPNGDGTANFVTTVEIVGGTRQYAHATGTVVAPGVLTLATGDTVGTYTADLCLGKGAP
jgi:hypothetical protein